MWQLHSIETFDYYGGHIYIYTIQNNILVSLFNFYTRQSQSTLTFKIFLIT